MTMCMYTLTCTDYLIKHVLIGFNYTYTILESKTRNTLNV